MAQQNASLKMNLIMRLFFLAEEASSMFRHFWVVTAICVVGMILSISIQYLFLPRQRWESRHFVVFAPLIFSFLTLLWGAVFSYRQGEPARANWISWFLLVFIVLQLAASIWVIWKMKGFRWFSVFAVVLQFLFLYGCVFVSGMAITGDWI